MPLATVSQLSRGDHWKTFSFPSCMSRVRFPSPAPLRAHLKRSARIRSGHSRMIGWPSPKPLTASQCWERAFDWIDKARAAEDPSTREMRMELADNWAFLAESRGREERQQKSRPVLSPCVHVSFHQLRTLLHASTSLQCVPRAAVSRCSDKFAKSRECHNQSHSVQQKSCSIIASASCWNC